MLCVHDEHAELPAPVDPVAPLQVGVLGVLPLPELLLHATTMGTAAITAATNIARTFMSSSRGTSEQAMANEGNGKQRPALDRSKRPECRSAWR
jgi:hypothetical protein